MPWRTPVQHREDVAGYQGAGLPPLPSGPRGDWLARREAVLLAYAHGELELGEADRLLERLDQDGPEWTAAPDGR